MRVTNPASNFRQPNVFLFLGIVFAIFVVALIIMASAHNAHASDMGYPAVAQIVAPATSGDAVPTWERFLANPLVVNILLTALATGCACLVAHWTGIIGFLKAHAVIKNHERLTASVQQLIGMAGDFGVAGLKEASVLIASAGPNPTPDALRALVSQAKSNGVAALKQATTGTALMADAKDLLGTGLDAHLEAAAGAAIASALLQTTGSSMTTTNVVTPGPTNVEVKS